MLNIIYVFTAERTKATAMITAMIRLVRVIFITAFLPVVPLFSVTCSLDKAYHVSLKFRFGDVCAIFAAEPTQM